MKKRRIMALFVTSALIVNLLSACGSSGSVSAPASSQDTDSTAEQQTSDSSDSNKKVKIGAQSSNTVATNYDKNVVDGKTIVRVGIEDDPGTMDPFQVGSSNGKNATIKSTVYQTLGMIQGVGGELAPEIAESWTKNDDGKTFDIIIRQNVHDSDGNPITADDIVFSYTTYKTKQTGPNAKYIESIEKTGDYSVRLVLTTAAVTLFERVMQSVYIVSEKAYEESPDSMATDPVCTGPYVVDSWTSGSTLVLKKNPDFWEDEELASQDINSSANVDEIDFSVIKEASQMAIALETGQIDMAYNLDSTEAQRFLPGGESADGFNVFTSINNLTQTMFLNVSETSAFYNNLDLRQAVLYSIDNQGLIDGAAGGYGVACKTFGSSELPDYNEKWTEEDYYDYNPEKAAELVKSSGYSSNTKLRIVTNNSSMRNKIAQIIQAYLLQVNIQSEIIPYDDTLFNTYKNDPAQWDILLDNCGTSDTLMGMWRGKMDNQCTPAGSANMAEDDKLQQLVEAAENPATNSAETVDALHQYMKDNAYVYGLFNNYAFTVTTNVCTDIMMNSTPWLMPSGCTYIWNK